MTHATSSIIRGITRLLEPERKLNIILFSSPIYEQYNYQLAKTGHNFYLWTEEFQGTWQKFYLAKPDNIYHLPPNQRLFDASLDFDFIIIHNRILQFDIARSISEALHIPIICVHHNDLRGGITDDKNQVLRLDNAKMQELVQRAGSISVYDSESMMISWQTPGSVIYPGIDTEAFKDVKPERNKCIMPFILNKDILNRILQAVAGITNTSVINPAWSEADNIDQYNKGDIFINLEQHYIDIRMLEAMAAGCAVISRPNIIANEIFENGKSVLYAESEQQLLQAVTYLLSNEPVREKIQQTALEIIKEKFAIDAFLTNWQMLFEQVSSIFYVR